MFGTELGSLTGDTIPDDIQSTGPDLYINFVSDDSENWDGFIIQYSVGKLIV